MSVGLKILKILSHILIVAFLTILTQVGGVIWILVFSFFKLKRSSRSKAFRLSTFALVYTLCSLFIVPQLAQLGKRTALPMGKSQNLSPHNYLTILLNRHYVRPLLKEELLKAADKFEAKHAGLKIIYLDANFPFINGFPLLPHLSHKDGRKVDIAFQYLKDGEASNYKPSNSGYGMFVKPYDNERDKAQECKKQGYWQYDYPKYLRLGKRTDLAFDKNRTKDLINILLQIKRTNKIFIEPHLKQRLGLSNDKIRFQGCRSVRHDDHIHLQIN